MVSVFRFVHGFPAATAPLCLTDGNYKRQHLDVSKTNQGDEHIVFPRVADGQKQEGPRWWRGTHSELIREEHIIL